MKRHTQIERIYYKAREAAEALGVCKATILRDIRKGLIPAIKMGNCWLIPVAALHGFCKVKQ
jgi:excisionase family DNA binding protein